jgi:hypothetical protein
LQKNQGAEHQVREELRDRIYPCTSAAAAAAGAQSCVVPVRNRAVGLALDSELVFEPRSNKSYPFHLPVVGAMECKVAPDAGLAKLGHPQ